MAAKKKYSKIPSITKSQILSEALMPGCLISNLAKSYGVSRQIIYSWRKDYRAIKSKVEAKALPIIKPQVQTHTQAQYLASDLNSHTLLEPLESNYESKSESQFVELLVQDSGDLTLKKASLIFSDFALTLEGRIKSSSLTAILKILEEEVRAC